MVSRFAHRSDPTGACVTGLGEHLPFPNSSFDLVCCHYLLLWVDDPLVILSEMLRVTRPGGGVLCLAEPDYGGRVDHPGSLEVLGALQEQALRSRGAEPRLGRRLRQLLHQAGLMQIQTGVLGGEWAGVGAGGSPADRDLEWHTLTGDVKEMLSRGDLARLEAEFLRATQDGSRLLFVPTFYGWGTRTAHPTPTSPLPRQMG
jgi:SAM-dependent methyltransferase